MSFFSRAARGFPPSSSKFLALFTISSGGLVAYSDSQSETEVPASIVNRNDGKKKRVVVLGTGWAGTSFIKDLDDSMYDVKVVSPRNYFAFTPLLPSVTCGTVEARSIVEPIRNMIRKRDGEIQFLEADCLKIDSEKNKIFCKASFDNKSVGSEEFSLEYDYLVIAVGAQVNTFNTPGVNENCHFLKDLEDAQRLRRTVIDCFEKAVLPDLTEEERRTNLHFVIVGGGPTGVEFAAELHDFLIEDLVNIYPTVKDLVKITLVQSGDHILNTFDERISSFAEQKFGRDGIEVQTGCRVVSVSDKEITMKMKPTGEVCSIPHGLVLWSTGISTRPVVLDFMEQIGQGNRRILATNEWLRVKETENIYALDKSGTLSMEEFKSVVGDILARYPQVETYINNQHLGAVTDLLKDALTEDKKEIDIEGFKKAIRLVDSQTTSLPATAQVAAQQGKYLARCFNRRNQSKEQPEGPRRFAGAGGRHFFAPFRYKHLGQFAPLGGEQAAAELPGDWVSMGHSTQWLWYSVYASKQVSWRTRYLVVSDWTRRYIFGRDSSRI
ncbi:External alternative NAD(P)H-ubiquinone oxidoreductase B1, mitochondrial [Linum perenne]